MTAVSSGVSPEQPSPDSQPCPEPVQRPFPTISLERALSELKELETPEGAPPRLFEELKNKLETILKKRGSNRIAKEPAASDTQNGIVVGVSATALSWNEVREGDYNNDGIVKADDLIPIAIHFGKTDDPDAPNYYKYAEYIDGDGDHIVGIGDVQAIADHFGESTEGYNIYEAIDSGGAGMSKVATILRPPVPTDLENPPWNISFATLQYDTSQGVIEVESAATKQEQVTRSGTGVPPVKQLALDGQATPPLRQNKLRTNTLGQDAQATWSPMTGRYYSVVPYGSAFDEQGEPILVERAWLASNWVYINIPPVAIFKADPSSGEAPVTVTFDARDSYDPDGYITNYLWDFDGDGLTDTVTQTPITTYEFTAPSVKPASLLVYDNAGTPSPKLTLPLHISGWVYGEILGSDDPHDGYLGKIRLAECPRGEIALALVESHYTPEKGDWYDLVLAIKKGDEWTSRTVLEDFRKIYYVDFGQLHGSYDISSDGSGKILLSFYDEERKDLVLYTFDTNLDLITKEIVDTEGDVGLFNSLALRGGEILISYYSLETLEYGVLKLARKIGDQWSFEIVDERGIEGQARVGGYTDIEVYDGRIGITYYDYLAVTLRYAENDGTGWRYEVIAEDLLGALAYNDLLYTNDGRPVVAFYWRDRGGSFEDSVYFAARSAQQWSLELVESGIGGSANPVMPAIAVTQSGEFYLTFREWFTSPSLWTKQQGNWKSKEVDPSTEQVSTLGVLSTVDDTPLVIYDGRRLVGASLRKSVMIASWETP